MDTSIIVDFNNRDSIFNALTELLRSGTQNRSACG